MPGHAANEPPDPPVDFGMLREICGGSEDTVRTLIRLFIHQSDESLEKLDAAVREGVAKDVGHWAHKFRGSCSSCGVAGLVPALRRLEDCSRRGDLPEAAALLATVRAEYARLRPFLDRYASGN